MKQLFTIIITLLIFSKGLLHAQTPTNCFEIESILVDACGTPENGNEMVRFKVGPNPMDASLMVVDWPNNFWLGLVQNAQTATTTANINSTITSCGYLVEPPAFILPAGSNVLLITSQFVNVTANSFANLSDTIYVLYQNLPVPTNNGHFSNSATTPRTLIIDFTSPANCGDTVTYLGSSLPGGNGAFANFEWDGTVSYDNNGCQAPLIASGIDITTSTPLNLCPGATLNLTAVPYGTYSEIIWSTNGNGTFSANNVASTSYISTVTDNANFTIYASIVSTCNDTITDAILVTVLQPTTKTISPTSYDLCPGETITLTATGGTGYLWNTFSTASSISVSAAGTYTVGITDGCYNEILSSVVTNTGTLPVVSVSGDLDICTGESTTITASGTGTFTWSNSTSGSTFTTSTAGTYTVTATNVCGSSVETFTISNLGSAPTVSTSGNLTICGGQSTTITASGTGNFIWSDLSTGTTFTTSTAGNYFVATSNVCGQDTAFFTITNSGTAPTVSISGTTAICSGVSTTLTASGSGTFLWNGTTVGATFITSTPGTYSVTATNSCGTTTESVTVTSLGSAPTASVSGDLDFCSPTATTILTASGGNSYVWSNATTNTTATYGISQNNYVVAVNTCGTDTAFFSVTNQAVTADFSASVYNGYTPLSVDFINTSTNATSYDWDFNNGSTSTQNNPSTVFADSGSYWVVLTVSNSFGCSASDSLLITTVSIPTDLIIPNIFTPNADGSNDLFLVGNPFVNTISGEIFNRWGQLMYSNQANTGYSWDGRKTDGDLVPDATYYYVFTVTFIDGVSKEYSGHLQLQR
jgi:gliding motility-associated-like protein